MKKHSNLKISLVLICMTTVLLFAGVSPAGKTGTIGNSAANDPPVYQIPQEKQDKWVAMESKIQKEYELCLEHCGFGDACADRCSQIYKTRLDRAYKELMSK